jgi:hypothetical protein
VEALNCGRCGAKRDTADNFCRECGHQLTINVPAVRTETLPAVPGAIPPSLIGSIAVLAVGTGLEWLARRIAGSTARAAGRALINREAATPNKPQPAAVSDDVTVDEFLYVRKIQLRR